jgi:hypothetical protein
VQTTSLPAGSRPGDTVGDHSASQRIGAPGSERVPGDEAGPKTMSRRSTRPAADCGRRPGLPGVKGEVGFVADDANERA